MRTGEEEERRGVGEERRGEGEKERERERETFPSALIDSYLTKAGVSGATCGSLVPPKWLPV